MILSNPSDLFRFAKPALVASASAAGISTLVVDVKGNMRRELEGKLKGRVYYFSTDPLDDDCDGVNFLTGFDGKTPANRARLRQLVERKRLRKHPRRHLWKTGKSAAARRLGGSLLENPHHRLESPWRAPARAERSVVQIGSDPAQGLAGGTQSLDFGQRCSLRPVRLYVDPVVGESEAELDVANTLKSKFRFSGRVQRWYAVYRGRGYHAYGC